MCEKKVKITLPEGLKQTREVKVWIDELEGKLSEFMETPQYKRIQEKLNKHIQDALIYGKSELDIDKMVREEMEND